jgi:hypothetical protein
MPIIIVGIGSQYNKEAKIVFYQMKHFFRRDKDIIYENMG